MPEPDVFRDGFDGVDPDFIDWSAYVRGRYTPPPQLTSRPDAAFILSGWGGRGLGVPVEEQRGAARALGALADPYP